MLIQLNFLKVVLNESLGVGGIVYNNVLPLPEIFMQGVI